MRKFIYFFGILIPLSVMSFTPSDFLQNQLSFSRVKNAYNHKKAAIASKFEAAGVEQTNFDLYIRAFKNEKKVEVYVKNKSESKFKKYTDYDFCETSGELGPKRKSGDKQIPEGFYKVIGFNPQSNYHLSFKIDYPNASDIVFADKINPGGDIYIHGDCATIGCIPIGDDNIDELYLVAALAKNCGGNMNVHIFPTRMTPENVANISSQNSKWASFWQSLVPAYTEFETTKELPSVSVNTNGNYIVK